MVVDGDVPVQRKVRAAGVKIVVHNVQGNKRKTKEKKVKADSPTSSGSVFFIDEFCSLECEGT